MRGLDMTGPRTQSQRDAVTVEIVYAAVTGALLAGAVFLAVAAPALFFDAVRGDARVGVLTAAKAAGATAFVIRVGLVLRRW
ncbi:DUF6332 family protein [Streptomyces sp. WMMC500]|uniref:DUF6332 family protein n=1 Tax=Streptomyces sp. WMMC500 TaxID=3015154 RepID=UPI00248B383A|nr:DUF6332 family protein [Streptomyces sp. WMMC500]WBB60726.1 DUF6332 family protein [Streptomyces sp. WMMC500]